ncbi:retrovirus-related pol polyprotein from transposon TNT 1-94, partial [Tanacetum coccineum]
KLDAKADIGIFIGYAPVKKSFRIYNKRTQKIIETIHVTFDELTAMTSEQFSSRSGLHSMTPATSCLGLVPNLVSQQPFAALRALVLADSLVSTSIDQDDPSSKSPSQGLSTNVRQTHAPFEHLDGLQNGFLEWRAQKEVYISQPKGFVDQDNLSHVYKLKKALYGLKQVQRAWYDMLSSFLISKHFYKGAVDPTLFTQQARNDLLLVQNYDDDIIFTSTNTAMFNEFANQMTTKFNMSMMGQMSFFLGLQISQSPRGIFINQSKYASEIVKKYDMLSTDSVDTPLVEKSKLDEDLKGKQVDATLYRGMIGSLMYLTSSRPVFIHAVCLCARTRRILFLGDKLVSWSSKKKKCTAISSTEAEYIALYGCCAQILWMRSQLTDYGFQFNKIHMYCDKKSVIALCCNNVQHSRVKHIDVRYHFIKDQVENGIVELYFVRTEYQLADIFTIPLPRESLNFLIEKLGMRSMSPETLKSLTEETDE